MRNKHSILKICREPILLPILVLLAFGAGILWWVAKSTASDMRSELLQQARIAARSISTDRISSLSGSPEDLNTAAYQRIKAQLKSMREARPLCKFLYLMGKLPNGKIFFFVDSLAPDSKNYAPPGLIYEEVSDSFIDAFNNMAESVVGPVTDRWGTSITALVPIKSPRTGILLAMLGMDVEASYWHKEILKNCSGPFVVTLLLVVLILLLALRENTLQSLKKREAELKHRTEFERVVSKISSKFAGLNLKNLDFEIEQALASIGTFASVDRASVFLFRKNSDLADNTHKWCAAGIAPQIDNPNGISIKEEWPWFADYLEKHKVLEIPDISVLPPDAGAEHGHLGLQGTKSFIAVPMVLRNRPIGFLGFHTITQKKKWTHDDQLILRLVGEVFSNAIDRRRIETTIRKSEEKFRAFFDQAAVGVSLTSMQTEAILQVNRKYCDIVGYSEEELKRITIREISHPDDLQAELDNLWKLKEGKLKEFSLEKRYIGKDDSVIWANLTVSSMWHDNEEPTQYITVIEDITKRKQMEAEVKQLSGLLPICASCKKIRDDGGYWRQIESYIRDHSDAEFSHGICPECSKKLYPDLD